MSNRRNLLVLAHFFPYAPVSGAAIRLFNLVENLSSSFDVYFMSFIDMEPQSDENQLRNFCKKAILIKRGAAKNLIKKIVRKTVRYLKIALFLKNPVIEEHNSIKLRKELTKTLCEHNFSVAMIESSWMAQYIPLIKCKMPSCKIVLDLYDLNSQLMKERVGFANNIFSRFYRWFLYLTMEAFEKRYIKMTDTVFTVSKIEEEKARQLSPDSSFVEMPNCIPLERYEGYVPRDVIKNSLIFTGWMGAFFNESAALYFYKNILPLIRQKGTDPVLYIVGGYPTGKIKRLAVNDPKIIVTGFVKDTRPFIANAEVFIVPNIEGSGTRLKILEALSMRKPVVSTPKGCEGLKVKDGEDILIRREPEGFADAVIRLLRDDNLKRRLAENGRELVRRYYSNEFWGRRLINIIEGMSIQ